MTDLKFCTSINDNLGKSLVKSRNRITKSTWVSRMFLYN
jgi:hypothetical protein